MKTKQQLILTEEDKKLLSQPSPENPCDYCLTKRWNCCGCDKQKKYDEMLKPYKDRGLLEYKMIIEEIKKENRKIMWIQGEINSLEAELPKELRCYVK